MRDVGDNNNSRIKSLEGSNRFLHWYECVDDWWNAYHIGNQLSTYLSATMTKQTNPRSSITPG